MDDNSDHDLLMAERDSGQRANAIHGEAYRQALSELAGEIYIVAYKDSLATSKLVAQTQWGMHGAASAEAPIL